MSLEDFKNIEAKDLPVGKLITMISRGHVIYLNHHLSEYDLNSSQMMLLFEISHKRDINQEQISERCNINKGAVARSIKKLEEKGFVIRKVDENNRRQNKISLTPKGNETLKKAYGILNEWEDEVIRPKGYIEKELLQQILKEIAIKTMELNREGI